MTLNILFLSITINKREISIEEAAHQEQIKKIYEETKDRQISIHHIMY
ncbi:YrzI family small protein [Neobacillus niacini]